MKSVVLEETKKEIKCNVSVNLKVGCLFRGVYLPVWNSVLYCGIKEVFSNIGLML